MGGMHQLPACVGGQFAAQPLDGPRAGGSLGEALAEPAVGTGTVVPDMPEGIDEYRSRRHGQFSNHQLVAVASHR